jgi:hypothetical protein
MRARTPRTLTAVPTTWLLQMSGASASRAMRSISACSSLSARGITLLHCLLWTLLLPPLLLLPTRLLRLLPTMAARAA